MFYTNVFEVDALVNFKYQVLIHDNFSTDRQPLC